MQLRIKYGEFFQKLISQNFTTKIPTKALSFCEFEKKKIDILAKFCTKENPVTKT